MRLTKICIDLHNTRGAHLPKLASPNTTNTGTSNPRVLSTPLRLATQRSPVACRTATARYPAGPTSDDTRLRLGGQRAGNKTLGCHSCTTPFSATPHFPPPSDHTRLTSSSDTCPAVSLRLITGTYVRIEGG
ncbi:hypothetical protein ElyMa_000514500 [Elysia marginata]|uniref:Uncharacterized protein n=1 Tax=Elysia marginata TaxID=1093978 RepID=A0AAV4FYD0_9GAST|nr:hypothetical protein ElyMa_000514500 [Elysia marginata]